MAARGLEPTEGADPPPPVDQLDPLEGTRRLDLDPHPQAPARPRPDRRPGPAAVNRQEEQGPVGREAPSRLQPAEPGLVAEGLEEAHVDAVVSQGSRLDAGRAARRRRETEAAVEEVVVDLHGPER